MQSSLCSLRVPRGTAHASIAMAKQQPSTSTRPLTTGARRHSPFSSSSPSSSSSSSRSQRLDTTTTTTTTTAAAAASDNGNDASNVMASNPLFANNPAFAAVLADSLNRQGADALTSGEESNGDGQEDREGAIEEMLASCMRDQRQAVVQLEHLEKAVKEALVRERRQFERLQFAFKKAASDRAYNQSLAKLRKREKEEMAAMEAELKKLRGG